MALPGKFGGDIGPAVETGDVANPGRPVFTGSHWVAGGSISTLATNQQRPAFFVSSDGAEWETIELDDVGSGSLGTVVVLPDGSLLALGCESPGGTNSGQFGRRATSVRGDRTMAPSGRPARSATCTWPR